MRLYLVRHAIAAERDAACWPADRDRPLTMRGRRRFAQVAGALRRLAAPPTLVLASPFRRAWQTACLLHTHAGWPAAQECAVLTADHDASEVLLALDVSDFPDSVALVGHEPQMSALASLLLTGSGDRAILDFKKGAVACLSFEERILPGHATLLWYAPPKLLRAAR